ncbi:MAG: type IV secretory system conjugative DNA transfer family protein [Eubacterium sp.]|nr:type IV secretory system conjugative DNA transfer family protein [Eubacterium sp.]
MNTNTSTPQKTKGQETKSRTPKVQNKETKSRTPKVQSKKTKPLDKILESNSKPNMSSPEYRMLAKDFFVNNNSHITGLNNNDLIIGASGRGKTTGYVDPLISQKCGSMIISDTKNCLYDRHANELKQAGYKVLKIDFMGRTNSNHYNPFDFITYDKETNTYNNQDISTIAENLCPVKPDEKDPFWPRSAQIFLTALISFLLEATPDSDHTPEKLIELISECSNSKFTDSIFDELESESPNSFAVTRYKLFKTVSQAEKTYSCIMIVVATSIVGFDIKESRYIYSSKSDFDFTDLGKEKIALFLNVSDSDRSSDKIVNIFYSQAMNKIINYADSLPDHRLKVPVRFILDDFATNTVIPNFSKLISVIRSREISVSIILQSVSQLNENYTTYESNTIMANCDHMLFLGTPEVETAKYIGEKLNIPYYNVLNMALNTAYVFESGNTKGGIKVEKYTPDYFRQDAI